jgi:hypothetical protein
MSAAGRLSILGLAVAAYLVASTTTEPPHLSQQQRQRSNPLSPGKSASAQSAESPSPLIEPTVVTMTERPVNHPVALGQPLITRGRDAVGRQLQKELRRVGCYSGELNGVWTTSTRQAMKAFTDRVNAMLPIDQPDGILLALVQGHPDKVCGAPCPAGQGFSRSSQCVPNPILAMTGRTKIAVTTNKRSTPMTSAWTVKTTLAVRVSPTTDMDRPGDIVPADAAPAAAAAPEPTHRRVAENYRRPQSVRRERNWASALFRFSVN